MGLKIIGNGTAPPPAFEVTLLLRLLLVLGCKTLARLSEDVLLRRAGTLLLDSSQVGQIYHLQIGQIDHLDPSLPW